MLHPLRFLAATAVAAVVGFAGPSAARAEPANRGNGRNDGLVQAIDQVMALVVRAQEKGRDAHGLERALRALMEALTHQGQHHHKHHGHQGKGGFAGGVGEMGGAFNGGNKGVGQVGAQANARERPMGNNGAKDRARGAGQVAGQVGGQCAGGRPNRKGNAGGEVGRGMGAMRDAVGGRGDRGAGQPNVGVNVRFANQGNVGNVNVALAVGAQNAQAIAGKNNQVGRLAGAQARKMPNNNPVVAGPAPRPNAGAGALAAKPQGGNNVGPLARVGQQMKGAGNLAFLQQRQGANKGQPAPKAGGKAAAPQMQPAPKGGIAAQLAQGARALPQLAKGGKKK